ncbi:50S ribosomal protein L4 [Blastopirellula marina]|uniref:Large ribosomal subunit protein uL4 n=1 Tax=Blastopirellula marina TaxID=124 RepID=A0A2S8FTZ8_9BACT|nr:MULTISPECIES: 50S ribosomal protein L4 [Pirellulaceae]PQO35657.1 50S ribosomal protein L4 [Blastopirellula marina]RCS53231.1 50S ribosomal protein L4 [Bremerella cremea]
MVSLPIFDKSGKEVGKYELDPAEIAPSINKQLMHDAVVMYQANLRQGTHRSKTRAEVAGSTKKMYRQKGTGNARAGSKRSGVRRGGGHIFAIRPRDYSYRLNKKALKIATRMAIASKIQGEQVVVVDDLAQSEIKTKSVAGALKALGVYGQKVAIALEKHDPIFYRSARNIEGVSVSPVAELNAYSVLRPRKLVITKAALDSLRSSGKGE